MAFTMEQIKAQANLTPQQFAQTAGVPVNNYIAPSGAVNIAPTVQPTQPVGNQYQSYVESGNGATAPVTPKDTYVNTVAQTTSPGSYQGVPIQGGADAWVAQQMAKIDADIKAKSLGTGSTGTTPPPADTATTTPPPAPEDPFEKYAKFLETPSDTTEASQYLNKLTLQSKLDQEKALASGETLGFATGEAQRVARNNALYLDAAGNTLQTLIARDASKKEIAKARFDYEQAKIKAERDAIPAPFDLSPGQKRYAYDSATKTYKEIASVPSTPKAPDKVTETEKKATMVSEVNDAANQLRQIVKAKGFEGISLDDYNTMREYLSVTYGYEALLELDKAIAAMGLQVDQNPNGKGLTKPK